MKNPITYIGNIDVDLLRQQEQKLSEIISDLEEKHAAKPQPDTETGSADGDLLLGVRQMLTDILTYIDNTTGEDDEAYREAARRLHGRDGECEIDSGAVVSIGDDPGAYVAAWVWVPAEDAGVEHGSVERDRDGSDEGMHWREECDAPVARDASGVVNHWTEDGAGIDYDKDADHVARIEE